MYIQKSKSEYLFLFGSSLLLLLYETWSFSETKTERDDKQTLAARALRAPSYLALARSVRRVLYASVSRSSLVIFLGASAEYASGKARVARVVEALRSSA